MVMGCVCIRPERSGRGGRGGGGTGGKGSEGAVTVARVNLHSCTYSRTYQRMVTID